MFASDHEIADSVSVDDSAAEIVAKVLGGAASALTDAARYVDVETLGRMARLIVGARRVLVVAVGTSYPLAWDVAYRFTSAGVDARFAGDTHVQHITAALLRPEDVCLAISHTGSTIETNAAVRAAQDAGAHTAAITSFGQSPLTDLVDHVIVAGSKETAHRIEAISSRIIHLSILDALIALVAAELPTSAQARAASADVLVEHRI
jgi:DNA-binding MurR/RpiR family transcriptional regulator